MPRTHGRSGLAPLLVAALGVAAAALLAGCGDDGGDVGSPAGGGPATGPGGQALYAENCAECHGGDLRGTDRGPSHLSQVYEAGHHPDDSFRAAIEQGAPAHHWDFGDMAPVEGLADDEIDAIIAYVREQQDELGFEPYPPG